MVIDQKSINIITSRLNPLAVFETLHEPTLVLDDGFHIILANSSFFRTFQTTPEETLGRRIYDLGNGQWNVPSLQVLLEDLLPKKKSFEKFEVDHYFPAIGRKNFLINAREVLPEETSIRLILIAFQDVTEEMMAQRAIKKELDKVKRSNIDLEQFANVAAHDLRSPLRRIMSFASLLESKMSEPLGETEKHYLTTLVQQGRQMMTLIDDLLNYGKMSHEETGDTVVDLHKICDDAWTNLSHRVTESHAEIQVRDMPAVYGKKHQIRQLFTNLLDNAIKYRKPDQPPTITVQSKTDTNGDLEVSVEDNGIGFDPRQSKDVFEPFQRLPGKSQSEGTGMGLAIARRVVESHGGRIAVESRPGEGSKFLIRFPSFRVSKPDKEK